MSEHLSDEDLARYLGDGMTADQHSAVEAHVSECDRCRCALEEMKAVHEALSDEDTWLLCGLSGVPDEPNDHLSAIISQAIDEDEQASELLRHLITTPAAIAYEDLPRKRRYHTAGVARYLCRAARRLVERDPPDALILADNAITIAEALDQRLYPSSMRFALIGSAWKERANALRMMGDYTGAEGAFNNAERAFRKTPHAESELARIQFGRATVYEKSEQLDRAMELALKTAADFYRLGDEKRRVYSMMIVGGVRQKRSMYAEARKTFLDLIPAAEALSDEVLVGRLKSNAAWAAVEMGLIREAEEEFRSTLPIFVNHGISVQVVCNRWGLGHVLLVDGKLQEAIDSLKGVLEEATRLQVHVIAGMIVLDIAEALSGLGRFSDISHLCRYAVSVFRRAGRTDGLLTALGYLKEAARQGALPSTTLLYLRQFLRRLDDEPNLLFIPPPG